MPKQTFKDIGLIIGSKKKLALIELNGKNIPHEFPRNVDLNIEDLFFTAFTSDNESLWAISLDEDHKLTCTYDSDKKSISCHIQKEGK